MQKENIKVGTKIWNWTIIQELPQSRSNPRRFRCKCVCGNIKNIYWSHIKYGASKSCGCQRPVKKKHYKWTGCGEITGTYWNKILRSARGKRNRSPIEINITIQYIWNLFLQQKRLCALTGLPIHFNNSDFTASLDRIDSNKGYIKGNVQWIHKDVNRMKNVYSQEHFVQICNYIAIKHPRILAIKE